MKKAFILCLSLLCLLTLVACRAQDGGKGTDSPDSYTFEATVLEVHSDHLLIAPADGSTERTIADKIRIPLDRAHEWEPPQVGDTVRITYDGIIQEMYPAILPNVSRVERVQTAEDTAIGLDHGITYVYRITEGRFAAYIGGKVIAADRVGEKLGEVDLIGGWRSNSDGIWQSEESLRGELYTIAGVPNEVAVALRFLTPGEAVTTTHYYVIMDPTADLTAVSDYVIPTWMPNNPGDE